MYADDLVLWGESNGALEVMVERLVEVYRRRSLTISADKKKVMVLGGDEGLKCKICVNGRNWSKCQGSNISVVFWTNQIQMLETFV